MSILHLDGLSFGYGANPVLHSIRATVDRAELIALIGPNGAGKSTLVNVIAGRLRGYQGTCLLHGQEIRNMNRRLLCRLAAHIPQKSIDEVPFSVEEVILTGRMPYATGLYESDDDFAALENALELTRLAPLRTRKFSHLSGGEQQRVLVAAAIAQGAPVLLLDEPGAHLDPENQTELWDLLACLRDQGKVILIVTHHLHLAAGRSDRIWMVSGGQLVTDAPPGEAMTPAHLESVFRVPFQTQINQGRVFLNYG